MKEKYLSSREAVEQNIKEHGITNFEEYEDVVKSTKFDILLNYINASHDKVNSKNIEDFLATKDNLARLEILSRLSIQEAIQCIQSTQNYRQIEYLEKRMKKLQTNLKKAPDRQKNDYDEYYYEESQFTPVSTKLGLYRDILYASTIGSPEMAIYKIVNKKIREGQKKGLSDNHMIELKGYHSGIFLGNIGKNYNVLSNLYRDAHQRILEKSKTQLNETELERKAIALASEWLLEAVTAYNPLHRGLESPYCGSIEEALAWTKLGKQAKRQFKAMRRKICGINLSNIGRFLGSSKDNQFVFERNRLKKEVENFTGNRLSQEFLDLKQQYEKINHKYDGPIIPPEAIIGIIVSLETGVPNEAALYDNLYKKTYIPMRNQKNKKTKEVKRAALIRFLQMTIRREKQDNCRLRIPLYDEHGHII